MKTLIARFTLGIALLGAAATAQARATYDTWVGNTSANFSGLNWTGANNPPLSGDMLFVGAAGTAGTALTADQTAGITYAGITFNTNAGGYTINGTNGITLAGGITNNSGNVETLKFPINCPAGVTIAANTNGITLSGTISGTGGITVVGGTVHWNNVMLTLAGTNTYTGPTVVSQGLLELAGSLTSTSAVTVAYGGMLQCSNTIAGPVAVTGLISAHGYTLNTGPETWHGSSYENLLELACGYCVQMSGNFTGTAGKDWDLLNINGALNIAATSDQPFVIRVEVPIFDPLFDNTRDYTWRIATASGGISGFDASKFLVERWASSEIPFNPLIPPFQTWIGYWVVAFDTGQVGIGTGQFVVTQSGNDLLLQFVHPTANPGTVYRAFGTYARIPVSAVLANVSDAPVPLTLTSVTSQNPNDYVQISGPDVLFAPANPNEPVSTLNYSVRVNPVQRTSSGLATNTVTGTLTVLATNAAGISRSITVSDGQAAVSFSGLPGSQYLVQRSTNLVDWVNLDGASGLPDSTITNTAASGIWTFTDPNPPASGAFYRTAQAYPTVLWGNLNPTYNGAAQTVTASSSPPGMAVSIVYYNSSGNPISPPANAGSYTVVGTIADGSCAGSATNTLTIAKATATITLTANGSATPSHTTNPPGLSVNTTSGPATDPNYYYATATINDTNYTGIAHLAFLYNPND